ncbi:MAG: thiamine phosphate synthase [Planctomycetota bacterium]
MPDSSPLRILDASANRATEGLRVVEDYVRFVLDDDLLTRLLKQARHNLAIACNKLLGNDRYPMRDTQQDVGTEITTESEAKRVDAWDVCIASLERTKQSLRSLEEFSKVCSPTLASEFESLRYRLYTLEKSLLITRTSQSRLEGVTLCTLMDGQESEAAFTSLVEKLIADGVGMIQLRDKQLDDRQLLERAKLLKKLAPSASQLTTLCIINDRPDIAAAANADGVHLGQDDLDVKSARAILGPRKLIGVSTHSIDQARQAVLDGANYLGAGPTFPSSTKNFDANEIEQAGIDYLRQVASEVTLPTFAIGGIDVDNLSQVLETGTKRIAVSSAASSASELLSLLKN